MLSRDEGFFVGLLLQAHECPQFIIAKVKHIKSDVMDPGNESIDLHQPDINGNEIMQNPIPLKDIKSVRVYKLLQGISHS